MVSWGTKKSSCLLELHTVTMWKRDPDEICVSAYSQMMILGSEASICRSNV